LDLITVVPYIAEVNQIQKLHLAGKSLLERLGLDNVRLEAEGNGRFTYLGLSRRLSPTGR
jgi:hypothetical protein